MNPSKLFELFDKARQHQKWPSLTIPCYTDEARFDRSNIKLGAGTDSNTIWVSNGVGKGNPNHKLFGKINREAFVPYMADTIEMIDVKNILTRLCEDPIKFGALKGQEFRHCIFCNTELTSKASLFAGYGPICADNWGLPWGEYKDESLENL